MAGISTKGVYGVIAAYYIYSHQSKQTIKSSDISSNMQLPQNYLEQILSSLKKSGILRSIRGANGGYVLARKGSEITVLEIIEALDGAILDLPLGDRACVLADFWSERSVMVKGLFGVTLAELDSYVRPPDTFSYTI